MIMSSTENLRDPDHETYSYYLIHFGLAPGGAGKYRVIRSSPRIIDQLFNVSSYLPLPAPAHPKHSR